MFSGVIVAELMTTNGAPARGDASWMQRAASSLPTPGDPVINTRELTGATFATICCNWTVGRDLPTIRSCAPERIRKAETSRRN